MNVTLDIFGALIDSRTGGSQVFDQITRRQRIDPAGPRPTRQVTDLDELPDYLAKGLPPTP